MVMKNTIILLILFSFIGCRPQRVIQNNVVDSIRVDVIERVVKQIDTVIFEIPVIKEKIITKDTSSILSNKYAISEAIILSGYLIHSLETKPVKEVIKTEIEYITRDSLVYRNKFIENTIEIERKETWWQRTQRTAAWILLSIIILFMLYKLRKLIKI